MTLKFIFYQVHLNSTIQSDQFIYFLVLFCFRFSNRNFSVIFHLFENFGCVGYATLFLAYHRLLVSCSSRLHV